jgi:hypothetical protein
MPCLSKKDEAGNVEKKKAGCVSDAVLCGVSGAIASVAALFFPNAGEKEIHAMGIEGYKTMSCFQKMAVQVFAYFKSWLDSTTGCLNDWLVSFAAGQVTAYADADVVVEAIWKAFPRTEGLVEDAVDLINAIPKIPKKKNGYVIDMGDIDQTLFKLFNNDHGWEWTRSWANSMMGTVIAKTSKERLTTLFIARGANDATRHLINKILSALNAEEMAHTWAGQFGIAVTAEAVSLAAQAVATGAVAIHAVGDGILKVLTGDTERLRQKRFERKKQEKAAKRADRHEKEADRRVKADPKYWRAYDKIMAARKAKEAGEDAAEAVAAPEKEES